MLDNFKFLDKKKIIIILVLIVILLSLIVSTKAKNCKTNDECFNKATAQCSLAKVITKTNDNLYNYEILGKNKDNCIIEVKLLNLSDSQPKDLKEALNDRSMKCSISREFLKTKTIKDIENINDHCTGPLKEAILEVTLEKMYELVVKNLGSISKELANPITNSTK